MARGNGEGSIYPIRDKAGKITGYRGAYYVYTPEGPKRKYLSGKKREDVRDKLAEALGNRADGLVFYAGTLTVGEYLERWLRDVVNTVRNSTYQRYEYAVRPHIKPALRRTKLKDLTPAHLRWFYRERLDNGLAPATVHKLHAILHKALTAAVVDGLVPRNVASGLRLPKLRRDEMDFLNAEEVKKLLAAAEGSRLEALYMVAISTGMRQGELLSLKWDDVDLNDELLRIRRTLTKVDKAYTIGEPKTKKSRRTIRLRTTAAKALRKHMSRQAEEIERMGSLYQPDGLVFAGETGNLINPSNLRNRSFRPLLKAAGLRTIRFHDLRHTCATLLLSKNVNPKVVSEMLGHSSVSITLDTYSHLMPEMQEQAAQTLEDLLG